MLEASFGQRLVARSSLPLYLPRLISYCFICILLGPDDNNRSHWGHLVFAEVQDAQGAAKDLSWAIHDSFALSFQGTSWRSLILPLVPSAHHHKGVIHRCILAFDHFSALHHCDLQVQEAACK